MARSISSSHCSSTRRIVGDDIEEGDFESQFWLEG
jgi:hypothetical protein